MPLWMIALAAYFGIGLTLAFIGPAARERRHEQLRLEWQSHDQPRWKLQAFAAAIAAGIILLWPYLAVSAARIEARRKLTSGCELKPFEPSEPPAELDRWIYEVQTRYPDALLPFADYEHLRHKLPGPWTDREHLDNRLSQLGYAITGFATSPEGQDLPVAVRVLERADGMPFRLTRMCGKGSSSLPPGGVAEDGSLSFQIAPKSDDEVWAFSSSSESWEHLAGRAGLAIVRERTVVDAFVTLMN